MRDLAPMMPRLKIALNTPNEEVIARVRAASEWSEKSGQMAGGSNITGIKLAYAGTATADPYAGFEARVVPENITLLPKTTNQTTGGNAFFSPPPRARRWSPGLPACRRIGSTARCATSGQRARIRSASSCAR